MAIWKNKYKNIDKAYRLCIFRCIIRLPYEVTHFRVYCLQTYYTLKCFIRHFLLKTCKVVYGHTNTFLSYHILSFILSFSSFFYKSYSFFRLNFYISPYFLQPPCNRYFPQISPSPEYPNNPTEITRLPFSFQETSSYARILQCLICCNIYHQWSVCIAFPKDYIEPSFFSSAWTHIK